jgi:hypothetical protein
MTSAAHASTGALSAGHLELPSRGHQLLNGGQHAKWRPRREATASRRFLDARGTLGRDRLGAIGGGYDGYRSGMTWRPDRHIGGDAPPRLCTQVRDTPLAVVATRASF